MDRLAAQWKIKLIRIEVVNKKHLCVAKNKNEVKKWPNKIRMKHNDIRPGPFFTIVRQRKETPTTKLVNDKIT